MRMRALWVSTTIAALILGLVGSATALGQEALLLPPDGAPFDGFGRAAEISGDTVVIGADGRANGAGAGYVFVRGAQGWDYEATLVAADGAANDNLGITVDVDGNTAVLGTLKDAPAPGAAYVFVREGTTWTQQAKLVAPAGVSTYQFGRAVAIDGDTIAVGAIGRGTTRPGQAVVYTRTGSTWSSTAQLVAADAVTGDGFGYSVDLDGGTLAVGAILRDDPTAENAGAAYVFKRQGAAWTQVAKLERPGATRLGQLFGSYVAVDRATVLVGTYQTSADVFVRTGATYALQANLPVPNGNPILADVALAGNVAVVGYPYGSIDGTFAAAYRRTGSAWTEGPRVLPPDMSPNHDFGHSVALSATGTLVVGDTSTPDGEGVYVYSP